MRSRPSFVAIVFMLSACAAPQVATTPIARPSPTATAAQKAPIDIGCNPSPQDSCAGFLTAGTHTSALFKPRLTYTVPADWANHADSAGEYVLLPPGSLPSSSDFGVRDWIAFEANVTLVPEGCAAKPQFDASKSAADIAAWMAGRSHLVTTSPKPVTVGGLNGLLIDVRLADGAPVECLPVPAVLLVHGMGASEGYDQAIVAGAAMPSTCSTMEPTF